jgi:hypothetical protein
MMFKVFCIKEFSVENILCFDEIQKFKKTKHLKKKKKILKNIIKDFIRSNAKFRANIPKNTKKKYKSLKIDDKKIYGNVEILNELETDIIQNLLDSYNRFFYSSNFKNYLKKLK